MDGIGHVIRNDNEKYGAVITAIGASFGSLAITSDTRAETVMRRGKPVDAKREAEHIRNRLGINATSVPAPGETIVTNAALAVIKMALLNDVDLDTITEVNLATESGKELSKNMALKVVDYVNRASSILHANGIEIGHLAENGSAYGSGRKAVNTNQYQNACAAAVQEIYAAAKDGLSRKTRKLIIASDDASYVENTPATETGGFGAVAMLLENPEGIGSGMFLSSEVFGEANIDSNEFVKEEVLYIGGGLSIISTRPIVFGNHSNYTYLLLANRSIKAAFGPHVSELSSIEDVTRYDMVPHVPYPVMPFDAAAYFLRHLARGDGSLHASLAGQIKADEPFLDGFTNLETELEFLHKVYEVYIPVDKMKEHIARLRDSDLDDETVNMLVGRLDDRASMLQAAGRYSKELEALSKRYGVGGELLEIMDGTARGLSSASKADSMGLDDMDALLGKLREYIDGFERADQKYNALVRETAEFKRLATALHLDEAVSLSREIGNIDTASAPLALISSIINTDNKKPKLMQGYGSGSNAPGVLLKAFNIDALKAALELNVAYELSRREFIYSAEEYNKLQEDGKRTHAVDALLPLSENALGVSLNQESLLRMAEEIAEKRKSVEEAVIAKRDREKSRSA